MKLLAGILIGIIIAVPGTVVAQNTWRDKTLNADYNNSGSITRFDDNRYQVKCWQKDSRYRGGLSCLPWSEVKER